MKGICKYFTETGFLFSFSWNQWIRITANQWLDTATIKDEALESFLNSREVFLDAYIVTLLV